MLIVPDLASEATIVPFPSLEGCNAKDGWHFSSLGLHLFEDGKIYLFWPRLVGLGDSQDRGPGSPQINPPAMALPLPHLVGKEPHVQQPMPAPLRAAFLVTSAGHGAWGGDVSRMHRGLLGILSASRCFFSCFSAPILSVSFELPFSCCSTSLPCLPSFPPLDWLRPPPAIYILFLKTSISLPSPWSAHLPPPQPGFVPSLFPTHGVLVPGGPA